MRATQYKDTYSQAERFIEWDKSDPFTRNRVYSHIANGLCDDKFTPKGEPIDCRYKADSYLETRKIAPCAAYPNGGEYHVTAYKNIQRP